MGTVDKSTHEFHCQNCGTRESVTIHQKGSNWGASWQAPVASKLFNTIWTTDKFGEPIPTTYSCLTCEKDSSRSQ